MRARFFTHLRSTLTATALFAVIAFGIQSIALPLHATAHTLDRVVDAGKSAAEKAPHDSKLGEAECDLCAIAAQPTTSPEVFISPSSSGSVIPHDFVAPVSVFVPSSALLPPTRAPPAALIASGL